jgi:glutamate dehydrogenase
MLPLIDNFGLKVIDQYADPVTLPDSTVYTIDTFRLETSDPNTGALLKQNGDLVSEGLEAVFAKKMATDSLNHLVLHAGLSWESVDLMRALFGYARQLAFPYTIDRLQSLFLSNTEALLSLWNLFEAKFNPDAKGNREKAIKEAQEHTEHLLRLINNQDQDYAFRTFFNLINSILRTNFYRSDRIFHYISFKIDCEKVQNMPSPRMMVEVYVHHREMEGIHLRGGKIARGGIRWSDRTDFRREVLDLVATQMVKNVLIVPEGAKGGFRMKEQILDWGQRRKKADELYQVLIRGLLDVTDNREKGTITHPPQVVRHDPPDPYLVVAADKGTAHLSDTANGLSAEYNFWLGDAFASGGSNGYDHKEVGITARGAWKTTIRHFEEMGLNPREEEYTAIGIGDPAGDVFGNGVIYLSQKEHANNKMKLLGAFNHLHIFLDPNPNAEVSYQERLRLFEAVKGWGEYDTSLVSSGGGVFSRGSKSIPLSPEVQQMLGVLKDELAPEVVIRLLLRLNVDLIWNGGIGTYVKDSHESDLDAGDPSNDSLRINGSELRARIIGEGGNLGFTQNGRIEYAINGGRLNTDAIDNSGGVDMSDHEVNIKILLNPLVQSASLSLERRNEILEQMTEEVAQAVLHNNNTHSFQISLDKVRSEQDPLSFSSSIQWVCNRSEVTRAFLRLPSDDELLRRQQAGQGLTRPELAVLAAHIKMHIFKELLQADTSIIPDFNDRVLEYFPQYLRKEYSDEISQHMLYQSIGMTMILNEVVGLAGAQLFPTLLDITGAKSIDIIHAWLSALETINFDDIMEKITALPSATARYHAWTTASKPLYSLLTSWLFAGEIPSSGKQNIIRKVLNKLPAIAGTNQQERIKKSVEDLKVREIPEDLAVTLSVMEDIVFANEIADGLNDERSINKAIVSYFSIGESSHILPSIRLLESRRSSGGWDPAANAILRSRFIHLQNLLTKSIDIGEEAKLGIDRVMLRLNRYHLAELRSEMQSIVEESSNLSGMIVANARAQSLIRKDFPTGTTLKGTGSIR